MQSNSVFQAELISKWSLVMHISNPGLFYLQRLTLNWNLHEGHLQEGKKYFKLNIDMWLLI